VTRSAPAGAADLTRLTRPSDVRRALAKGRHRGGRLLSLHAFVASAVGPQDATRLTVVASRRVGNAVRRNRAKRLLREAARAQAWRGGLDVVLVARTPCADSGADEVRRELERLGGDLELLVTAD
jgi:ribonuclease P protein component